MTHRRLPATRSLLSTAACMAFVLAAATGVAAAGQGVAGVNIDFGVFGTPSSSYGAASGQAGSWNAAGLGVTNLVDLSGAPSGVSVDVSAFSDSGSGCCSWVTDDELLLNDNYYSANGGVSWSAALSGLGPGNYMAYLYAPSNTFVSTGTMTVGIFPAADLPGSSSHVLVEGTSWSQVQVSVTDGTLSLSGVSASTFSGLSGLQLVPVSGLQNYCTAGVSASGCRAIVSTTGTPSSSSASGFLIGAATVEGAKDGLFFFGVNGKQASSWGNGSSYQCVRPPVMRTPLLIGAGTVGACDGSFVLDLNAQWAAKPAQNPGSGAVVQAQLWYRDPWNTSNQTTSLSDAVEFTVGP